MDKQEYTRRVSIPKIYLGNGAYAHRDEKNDMCYCEKTKMYMGTRDEAMELMAKYPRSPCNY